jgi:hypothetical protein
MTLTTRQGSTALQTAFLVTATFLSFIALGAKMEAIPAPPHGGCLSDVDCWEYLGESCVAWSDDEGKPSRTCERRCEDSSTCRRQAQCVNWRGGRGSVCLFVRWPSSTASTTIATIRERENQTFKECVTDQCVEQALAECQPAHELTVTTDPDGSGVAIDLFVIRRSTGCRVAALINTINDCSLVWHECPNLTAALSREPEPEGCSSTKLEVPWRCAPPYRKPFPYGPEF